jgi:hypothetical protein
MSITDFDTQASSMFNENLSLVELLRNNEININNETEYEPSLFQTSNYYSNDEFCNLLKSKNNNFLILSLNCQSLHAKFGILKTYIENFNDNNSNCQISAICLQETWLTAGSDLSLLQINGYNMISVGKSCSAHSGLAIYLKEHFDYRVVEYDLNTDIWDGQFLEISVETYNDKAKIILCNVYRPPRQLNDIITSFKNDMISVMNKFRNFKNVIITGDFNIDLLKFANHTLTNEYFESFISHGYIPKVTLPTRLTQRTGTLIDNFFVKIADEFSRTTSGILLCNISDHLPYFTCLDYLYNTKPKCKYVKVYPSFDTALINFKQDLQTPDTTSELRNIVRPDSSINKSYDSFSIILKNFINKHFQAKIVKYNKYKQKKCIWITYGILKSIRYRDRLYIKLKSTSSDSNNYLFLSTQFKTYNKILKYTLREAKRLHYQNCFKKFQCDIRKTWQTINELLCKTKSNNEFPTYFIQNDLNITDSYKIADEFNKYFINVGPKLAENIVPPPNMSYINYLKNPIQNTFLFETTTVNEVIKIIDSMKPKTSRGVDLMSNKLLKYVKYELAPTITDLINLMIKNGTFPDSLKIAKVIPLFKKDNSHYFENYRPISILPSVSKVFERVIYNQIYKYFTDLNLFYKNQHGFRAYHSTEFAALQLLDKIIFEMDNNRLPINIYMDLSKAFDTLDHTILLTKLMHYGFRDKSFMLLKSYLNKRTQYVDFNDISSECLEMNCGVPQGSILGPLLFIIYVNDLSNATRFFEPIIYADDTTLFASLTSSTDNTQTMDMELQHVSNWLKLNKLSLNVTKTKAMIFHSTRRHVHPPDLLIDGMRIEFVEKFNFLGLILDQNLKWNYHIDSVSKKVSKILGIMTKLKNCLPQQILLTIYNSLILSHMNYGLIVWGGKSGRLLKLQKRAVRIITKSRYNAHTNGLFKQLNVLKVEDLCALHDYKFCYKMYNEILPEYFLVDMMNRLNENSNHDHYTRQSNDIRLPAVRHEFARYSISYRYPSILNNMPSNFKEKFSTHSLSGFKIYFKRLRIASYHTNCIIPNCFVCQA